MVGRKVGQYQFLEKLGAGGMGEIYKAQDTRLGRIVAIKVLPSAKSGDPERRRRFLQEAQAASGLNHPSIITIHDIVSEGDTEFMVMEYVPGKTVNDLIPKGGLRVPQALKYALQISDALNVAHSAGIVHRDLKPANIMVTDSGLVKVLDFGLAKLTDRSSAVTQIGEDAETIAATSPMTVEGSILGTVSYMSPEQAQGKKVDPRSDIFSFGAVFYEMLTGRRAFEGDSSLSTLSSILRDEAKPMIDVAPDVPPQLEAVIQQCLRKMPDDRWQTMREVQAALSVLKRESDSGSLYGSRLSVSAIPAAAGIGAASSAVSGMTPPSASVHNMSVGPPTATGALAQPQAKKLPMAAIAIGVVLLGGGLGAGLYLKHQSTEKATAEAVARQAADEAAAKAAAEQAAADAAAQAAEAAKLAEETVNNDSVVELVTAKVPTAVILEHIRDAKVTNFNFSTAELIRLSKAGVSATIMDQMRDPKRTPPPAPAPAPAAVAKSAPAPASTSGKSPATSTPSTPAPAPAPVVAEPTPAKAATTTPTPPPPAASATPQTMAVEVPDGMPFRITLGADIPANVDLSTPLRFTLPEDFKVNNVVVLPRGATVTGEISETAGKRKFMNLVGGTKLSFTLTRARGAGAVELKVRALSARREDGATQRPVDTGKGGTKTVAAPQGTEYIGYIDGMQTVNVPK